jgi:hypothetical protein
MYPATALFAPDEEAFAFVLMMPAAKRPFESTQASKTLTQSK